MGRYTKALVIAKRVMLSRRVLVAPRQCTRALSTRASTVLSGAGIPVDSELPGVYHGEWVGSGDILESVCPATGEVLARVRSVSVFSGTTRRGAG